MKSILLTLFLASNVGAVSVHSPSPNGTAITPTTVTSAGCIKTDADGTEFNANCTAGKVGIGAAVPSAALHVSSGVIMVDGTGGGVYFIGASTITNTEASQVNIRHNAAGYTTGKDASITFGSSSLESGRIKSVMLSAGTAAMAFSIGTTLAEGMRLTPTGLGIGTTLPSSRLHISSGTLTLDGNVSPSLTANNAIRPAIKTKAQIHAITPAQGDVYVCSDCTNTYTLCVGTGTAINDFREVGTATGCTP